MDAGTKRSLSGLPPYKLAEDLPSEQLLNYISKTSEIAEQHQYLVSIKSDEILVPDHSINFQARIASNLTQKPNTITRPKTIRKQRSKRSNPFVPPFPLGSHICDLNEEYRLLLNKYNLVSNHVLIVTSQFEAQSDGLTAKDFEMTWKIIQSMNGLSYYNNGPFSGASQQHKHIQVLPRNQQYPIDHLVQNMDVDEQECETNAETKELRRFPEYDFVHRVYLMKDEDAMGDGTRLYNVYCRMLEEIKYDISENHDASYVEADVFSYNLLMSKEYMFVVARKKEAYCNEKKYGVNVKVHVNSMGFAGSFFCKNEKSMELLKETGPLTVLRNVSFSENVV